MPKTYTTIPSVVAGETYSATAHNVIATTINNHTVPPSVSVYSTANVTCANNAFTRLSFTTANYDTDSMKGAGTVTGLSINTTGLYLITCYVTFDTNATGNRGVYIDRGTASSITTIIGYGYGAPQNANYSDVLATALVSLTAGDTIQAFGWQNSGGNLDSLGGLANRAFAATWIGRTS